jgi:hypothetical protein
MWEASRQRVRTFVRARRRSISAAVSTVQAVWGW